MFLCEPLIGLSSLWPPIKYSKTAILKDFSFHTPLKTPLVFTQLNKHSSRCLLHITSLSPLTFLVTILGSVQHMNVLYWQAQNLRQYDRLCHKGAASLVSTFRLRTYLHSPVCGWLLCHKVVLLTHAQFLACCDPQILFREAVLQWVNGQCVGLESIWFIKIIRSRIFYTVKKVAGKEINKIHRHKKPDEQVMRQ